MLKLRRFAALLALTLAACGGSNATGSSSGSTSSGSSGTTSSSTSGTTGSSGTTSSSSTSGSSGTSGNSELQTILNDLRADTNGALASYSTSRGWPIHLASGGYLFVSTNSALGYVAGDFDTWAGEPLTADTGFSYAVLTASPGDHYKFTDHTNFAADPWARSYWYDQYGEISWIEPSNVAHLDRWMNVSDANMQARTLNVLVPAAAITHVLYAHDGNNLFDPNAPWGGWKLQDSAPAGMLIVGIDNTPARMDEYTHVQDVISGQTVGGKGAQYADFIENTVRPLIRAHYGESGPIGTLGSSLGGLISLVITDRYPGEYRFAASMSGTAGWGSIDPNTHNQTIIERYAAAGHEAPVLYVDSGGYGTTCADSDNDGIDDDDQNSADNYCENVQLHNTLLAHGYTDNVDVFYWYEANATHDEAHWATRVFRPLQIFAGLQ